MNASCRYVYISDLFQVLSMGPASTTHYKAQSISTKYLQTLSRGPWHYYSSLMTCLAYLLGSSRFSIRLYKKSLCRWVRLRGILWTNQRRALWTADQSQLT